MLISAEGRIISRPVPSTTRPPIQVVLRAKLTRVQAGPTTRPWAHFAPAHVEYALNPSGEEEVVPLLRMLCHWAKAHAAKGDEATKGLDRVSSDQARRGLLVSVARGGYRHANSMVMSTKHTKQIKLSSGPTSPPPVSQGAPCIDEFTR